jgi:hypothetical protein
VPSNAVLFGAPQRGSVNVARHASTAEPLPDFLMCRGRRKARIPSVTLDWGRSGTPNVSADRPPALRTRQEQSCGSAQSDLKKRACQFSFPAAGVRTFGQRRKRVIRRSSTGNICTRIGVRPIINARGAGRGTRPDSGRTLALSSFRCCPTASGSLYLQAGSESRSRRHARDIRRPSEANARKPRGDSPKPPASGIHPDASATGLLPAGKIRPERPFFHGFTPRTGHCNLCRRLQDPKLARNRRTPSPYIVALRNRPRVQGGSQHQAASSRKPLVYNMDIRVYRRR